MIKWKPIHLIFGQVPSKDKDHHLTKVPSKDKSLAKTRSPFSAKYQEEQAESIQPFSAKYQEEQAESIHLIFGQVPSKDKDHHLTKVPSKDKVHSPVKASSKVPNQFTLGQILTKEKAKPSYHHLLVKI
ncbi:unnamed protein product [Cochlearia groenlandica]